MKTNKLLKCIIDDNRRKILNFLGTKEKCVCEIVDHLNLEQSLISHHLYKLKKCGLVTNRQQGKNILYKITDKNISKLLREIQKVSRNIERKSE